MLDSKKTAWLGVGSDPQGTARLGLYDSAVANVKVSWFQFNTEAVPYETKVNWLQFDTEATQENVKVNWLQFDTQAGTGKSEGRSGYWRLFYQQLQEEELAKLVKVSKPVEQEQYDKVVELPDGSAKVIPFKKPEPKQVKKESERVSQKQTPVLRPVVSVKKQQPQYLLETMRVQMEISRLFTAWQIPAIIYSAQDTEDEELLLLLAA